MKKTLNGLIAAPFTPFNQDGSLALATVPAFAALLAHNGVSGAFVCGTTGEGCSLTNAERRSVAEAWRAATPPQLALIVHVGHLSLGDARELARHAQEIGADAIATIAPGFFKPAGPLELADWGRAATAVLLLSHARHDRRRHFRGGVSGGGRLTYPVACRCQIHA